MRRNFAYIEENSKVQEIEEHSNAMITFDVKGLTYNLDDEIRLRFQLHMSQELGQVMNIYS